MAVLPLCYLIPPCQLGTLPPTVCNSPSAIVGDAVYIFSGHSGKDTSNRCVLSRVRLTALSLVSCQCLPLQCLIARVVPAEASTAGALSCIHASMHVPVLDG